VPQINPKSGTRDFGFLILDFGLAILGLREFMRQIQHTAIVGASSRGP
jgi:hypothetical protein